MQKNLYFGEGKSQCEDKCPVAIKHTEKPVFLPEKQVNEHAGIPVLKVALFALLMIWGIASRAQDTICLPADRVARIADTIAHLRQYRIAYEKCDTLLELQYQFAASLREEIIQKNRQILYGKAALDAREYEVQAWRTTAEEHAEEIVKLNKRLNRARKARKTWMGTALGILGAGGAAVGIISAIK